MQSTYAGTAAGQKRATLRCRDLALSPTGTMWVAATTEGMLLYSLATETLFDPTHLTEDTSVPAMHRLIGNGSYLKALLVAVRLADPEHIRHVIYSVPPDDMPRLVAAMPSAVAVPVFHATASHVGESPHIEYVLAWAQTICEVHGPSLQRAPRTSTMPAFRALQKGLQDTTVRLRPAVEMCSHLLDYIQAVSGLEALCAQKDTDMMVEE
jgi:periodic tryptophan protein 2